MLSGNKVSFVYFILLFLKTLPSAASRVGGGWRGWEAELRTEGRRRRRRGRRTEQRSLTVSSQTASSLASSEDFLYGTLANLICQLLTYFILKVWWIYATLFDLLVFFID
jgi:hypothetical protein